MYWITGILGLAFAAAPFVFGYADDSVAMWTSVILGGAVTIASFVESADGNRGKWEYWATAVTGFGAILAPFVLGFGSATTAMWTSVGIGFLLAVMAGSKLYYDKGSFI